MESGNVHAAQHAVRHCSRPHVADCWIYGIMPSLNTTLRAFRVRYLGKGIKMLYFCDAIALEQEAL